MIEAILLLVIVALTTLIGWLEVANRKERKTLLNAILAKDNTEMVNLELADKTKIEAKPVEVADDLVDIGDLSEGEFNEHVLGKQNNG